MDFVAKGNSNSFGAWLWRSERLCGVTSLGPNNFSVSFISFVELRTAWDVAFCERFGDIRTFVFG
jgi:hypothetical protein